MLQLVTDYPTVQVLHVAAQLRLADLLAAGPQRIEDLAAATGTHAPSLARLVLDAAQAISMELGVPQQKPGTTQAHIRASTVSRTS